MPWSLPTSSDTPNVNGIGCDANGCLAPLPQVQPMGYGARMQYTGSKSDTPSSYPSNFTSPNKWVKLSRSGNSFSSWISSDGSNWTLMGNSTVAMSGPVTIGLFTTSHNIGQDTTAAFDNVTVTTPSPGPAAFPLGRHRYRLAGHRRIGQLHQRGLHRQRQWGRHLRDQRPGQLRAPDGHHQWRLVARVTSETNTSTNGKAGVMFKQSTTSGSDYILITTSPQGVIKVEYDFNGSITQSTTYTFPNAWMKLAWEGGNFTAYLSDNGVTWTQALSKTLPITSPATVGLFECSHNVKTWAPPPSTT